MKYIIIPFCLSILFCSSNISYVATGREYSALSDTSFVKVYITTLPKSDSYEEIGIVDVSGGDLKSRINRAKKKARNVGGNGLISIQEQYRQKWENETRTIEEKRQDKDGKEIKITKTKIIPEQKTWTEQRFVIIKLNEKI